MIVAGAFFGFAALIQQRTKRKAALWLSGIFALIGGIAFAGSVWADNLHGVIGNMWSGLPGLIGCAVITVIIIDVTDLKPNWPAVACLFFAPTFFGAAVAAFTSSGLPAAVTLGIVAGIIQHRAGSKGGAAATAQNGGGRRGRGGAASAASGGGRGKKLKWLSIPIAFAGGVFFAVTELANDLDRQIDKVHFDGSAHMRGAVGLFIIGIAIIDLVDGKPDKPAAICAYALPMFFFPTMTLIGYGFSLIG